MSIYFIALSILIILWIKHTLNTFSDLCTSTRNSLQHRSKVPKLNTRYIATTSLTAFCITCYTITTILAVMGRFKYIISISSCAIIAKTASIFYTIAKASLYTLFLCWLHSVYGSSAYKYSPKLLYSVAIINTLYCVIFSALIGLYGAVQPHSLPGSVGILCNLSYPKWFILSFGAYDIGISILFMIAFNYPLYRVRKDKIPDTGNGGKQTSEILVKTGIRSKILIWTAIISTILILGFMAIVGSAMFFPVDTVINCVCIVLMAPYYPEKYYKGLCCLCIKCYGGSKQDYADPKIVNTVSASQSSV